MRWWIPIAAVAGLVVIVIVVGVVLLSIQDVSTYKDFITRKVSEETGRELVIVGDFDLEISFSPSIVADNVTFQNAGWGSRPQMLKLGHVDAEVALFPMLFGEIKVKRLILVDLDILAETNEDGLGNWRFGEKETRGDGGGELPVIADMRIENALLRFQDGQTGERHVVMISHGEGSSDEADGVAFALEGIWNNSPVNMVGSLGAGDSNVPVALTLEMFGANIEINGSVGDPKEFENFDLDIRIAGERFSDLNMVAGSFPPIGPYTVRTRLRDAGGDSYIFDSFQARLADSDVAGTITLSTGDRPRVTAELTSSKLDLDALLAKNQSAGQAVAGAADAGEAGGAPRQAAGPRRIFSDAPWDLAALDAADADVSLTVADLRYGGLAMRDAVLGLKLDHGVLKIDPLRAGLADGAINGKLELHSRAQPVKLRLALHLRDVDLAAIKPLFDLSEVVNGPLDLDVSLAGQGRTAHEIAASLNGRIDLVIGAGAIPNAYVDLIAADLLRFIVPGSEGGDGARLNCFVARFAVRDGVAISEALLLDTALTTTAGKGSIDFGREVAELTIVPRPKDPALFSLAIPLLIDGPLLDLSYNLKKEEALLGLAGAVLGTVLLGPFGVLIPLVSAGTGDENPCLTALARPVGNAKPAPTAPTTPERAVKGVVEDILGIFE